jgi:uncharacterized protein
MSTKDRGFASMDRSKQRAIASQGGKAAHAGGRKKDGTLRKCTHEWTVEEARAAGRKGGAATQRRANEA